MAVKIGRDGSGEREGYAWNEPVEERQKAHSVITPLAATAPR
jgi:hypothetical protein